MNSDDKNKLEDFKLEALANSYQPANIVPDPSLIYVPSRKLANRVAIVTASTQGIGFAIARKLATDGAKVVISSRNQKNVDNALKELKSYNLEVSGLVCHVGKEEDRQRLVDFTIQQYGRIDFLVSNAAVNPHMGEVLECTESQYDKIFDVNVKAAFFLIQKVVPYMRKVGGGSIILIGSIAGFVAMSAIGVYSVSKTALCGLTKQLSKDLAKENIRVNNVVPGVIKTAFSEVVTTEATQETTFNMTDARRYGHPDELGGICSFLCSHDASFITGENICVSGGYQTRL